MKIQILTQSQFHDLPLAENKYDTEPFKEIAWFSLDAQERVLGQVITTHRLGVVIEDTASHDFTYAVMQLTAPITAGGVYEPAALFVGISSAAEAAFRCACCMMDQSIE